MRIVLWLKHSWPMGIMGMLLLGVPVRRAAAQQDSAAARPDSSALQADSLAQRLDQLDQEVRILKRLGELSRDSAAAAAKAQPVVSAGRDGFQIRSADGKNSLRIRGYLQVDGRFYVSDSARLAVNQLIIRRARPILEATVAGLVDFRLMPDFGGNTVQIFDAYGDIRFNPAAVLRAGKFKPPLGLERLQSAADMTFAERGFPTNLVPTRDIGVELYGEAAKGVVSYQVGVFNGVPDLTNLNGDINDAKDVAARIFLLPVRIGTAQGLGIGVAASTGWEEGFLTNQDLPVFVSPGQLPVFRYRGDATAANTTLADGTHTRLAPQGYFYDGPLGVLAEYTTEWQAVRRDTTSAKIHNWAWQVAVSYFLTGEKESFRSATPRHSFDLKDRHYGALEVAARYGQFKIGDNAFPYFANPAVAISKQEGYGIAVNWYFITRTKLTLEYDHTSFTGGAPDGGDRQSEHFLVTEFQFSF